MLYVFTVGRVAGTNEIRGALLRNTLLGAGELRASRPLLKEASAGGGKTNVGPSSCKSMNRGEGELQAGQLGLRVVLPAEAKALGLIPVVQKVTTENKSEESH